MASKSFTLLNNGNTTLTVTGVSFSTPVGIRHRADLTNFGGSSDFTGTNLVCSRSMAAGSSLTFSVDHEYVSGSTADTRFGTITISSNLAPPVTINTTIVVGSGGGGDPNEVVVSLVSPLPGQPSTYSAVKSSVTDGLSDITLTVGSDGRLTIDANSGPGLNSNWLTPYPASAGSNYAVRFTRGAVTGSGAYSASNSTTWLNLGQSRTIVVSATGLSDGTSSTVSVPYTVEISADSGATVASSGVYTLQATGTLQGVIASLEPVSAYVTSAKDTAGVFFNPDGTRTIYSYSRSTPVAPWFSNSAGGTPGLNYYIRATKVGIDFPSIGTLNEWISLAQVVSWRLSGTSNTDINCSLYVEISTTPSAEGIVSAGYINLIAFRLSGGSGNIFVPLPITPLPIIPIYGGFILDDYFWKIDFQTDDFLIINSDLN